MKTKLAVSNEISAMLKTKKRKTDLTTYPRHRKKVMKDTNFHHIFYSWETRQCCQSKYVLTSKCLRLLTYCGYVTPSDFFQISDPVASLTFSTAGIACMKDAAKHRWGAGVAAQEQNACNR